MRISYYELLGMIRNGIDLKDLKVYLTGNEYRIYTYCSDSATDDFSHYEIKNKSDIDDNYRDYLSECFLESMMFDKCIEFVEEQDKLIPKHITNEFIQGLDKYMTKQDIKHIAHKINEIINYLQHKAKGSDE